MIRLVNGDGLRCGLGQCLDVQLRLGLGRVGVRRLGGVCRGCGVGVRGLGDACRGCGAGVRRLGSGRRGCRAGVRGLEGVRGACCGGVRCLGRSCRRCGIGVRRLGDLCRGSGGGAGRSICLIPLDANLRGVLRRVVILDLDVQLRVGVQPFLDCGLYPLEFAGDYGNNVLLVGFTFGRRIDGSSLNRAFGRRREHELLCDGLIRLFDGGNLQCGLGRAGVRGLSGVRRGHGAGLGRLSDTCGGYGAGIRRLCDIRRECGAGVGYLRVACLGRGAGIRRLCDIRRECGVGVGCLRVACLGRGAGIRRLCGIARE